MGQGRKKKRHLFGERAPKELVKGRKEKTQRGL